MTGTYMHLYTTSINIGFISEQTTHKSISPINGRSNCISNAYAPVENYYDEKIKVRYDTVSSSKYVSDGLVRNKKK